jgi:anti-anti-sigma factor
MGLQLTSQRRGRCLVVNVCGNVGAGTEGQLHTGLRAALESDLLLIAANLAEAVLADAYALDVLTSIHRRAAAASKVFLVVAPDPQAHETMRVTGLDRSLLVFPTVADFNAWNGDHGTQSTHDLRTRPDGGVAQTHLGQPYPRIKGWQGRYHRIVVPLPCRHGGGQPSTRRIRAGTPG